MIQILIKLTGVKENEAGEMVAGADSRSLYILAEDWSIIPDDRQTRIETVGATVIQDFGHVREGDIAECRATISADDMSAFFDFWESRIPVEVRRKRSVEIPVTDIPLTKEEIEQIKFESLGQHKLVVKKYGYVENFPNKYYWAELEFWGTEG